MILSDHTIKEEVAAGRIVIEPYDPAAVQPSSVDLRLDHRFVVFRNHTFSHIDVHAHGHDRDAFGGFGADDAAFAVESFDVNRVAGAERRCFFFRERRNPWLGLFLRLTWAKFLDDCSELKSLFLGTYEEEWEFMAVECEECEEDDCTDCELRAEFEEDEDE